MVQTLLQSTFHGEYGGKWKNNERTDKHKLILEAVLVNAFRQMLVPCKIRGADKVDKEKFLALFSATKESSKFPEFLRACKSQIAREAISAWKWFWCNEKDYIFSIISICEILGYKLYRMREREICYQFAKMIATLSHEGLKKDKNILD